MSKELLNVASTDLLLLLATLLLIYLSYRYQKREYEEYGLMFRYHPWSPHLFFAPVYEEILFRGLILVISYYLLGFWSAVVISATLFGLWHIKNLSYQSKSTTIQQCLYTALFLGPLLAYITLISGSIFPAIFLHAINNYWAPISQNLFQRVIPR